MSSLTAIKRPFYIELNSRGKGKYKHSKFQKKKGITCTCTDLTPTDYPTDCRSLIIYIPTYYKRPAIYIHGCEITHDYWITITTPTTTTTTPNSSMNLTTSIVKNNSWF